MPTLALHFCNKYWSFEKLYIYKKPDNLTWHLKICVKTFRWTQIDKTLWKKFDIRRQHFLNQHPLKTNAPVKRTSTVKKFASCIINSFSSTLCEAITSDTHTLYWSKWTAVNDVSFEKGHMCGRVTTLIVLEGITVYNPALM